MCEAYDLVVIGGVDGDGAVYADIVIEKACECGFCDVFGDDTFVEGILLVPVRSPGMFIAPL